MTVVGVPPRAVVETDVIFPVSAVYHRGVPGARRARCGRGTKGMDWVLIPVVEPGYPETTARRWAFYPPCKRCFPA